MIERIRKFSKLVSLVLKTVHFNVFSKLHEIFELFFEKSVKFWLKYIKSAFLCFSLLGKFMGKLEKGNGEKMSLAVTRVWLKKR